MTVQQKERTPKDRVRPGENSIHYIRGKQKARAPVGCTQQNQRRPMRGGNPAPDLRR